MAKQEGTRAEALRTALQMELEGKEFYQRSAERSYTVLARDLFSHLAEQEDVHYRKVKEVYEAVAQKHEWPSQETAFRQEKSLRSVFREAIESMGEDVTPLSAELEAMQAAMKLEGWTYSFYRSRDQEATSPAEKAFYQALTAEERVHYLTLMDSYEYLSDPQGWFSKSER